MKGETLMRRQRYTFLFILAVFCIGLLTSPVYAGDEKPAETKVAAQQDDWEFVLELYGWMAELDATAPNGVDVDITFSDILDNLDIAFMSAFGAQKNKWTFMVDALYLDIENDSKTNITDVLQLTDMYLEAWIVHPFVSYEILGNEKGSLQLKAGPRYFWLELGTEIDTQPPLEPGKVKASPSDDVWDAVVGIRGFYNLAGRWYIPYVLDVGTGDSDYTWSALAGVGYEFEKFKVLAVYRYMHWEFKDNFSLLEDLTVKGPAVGAIFKF